MTHTKTSDLHCHLNGSFSRPFLKETAQKNNCLDIYEEFVSINDKYLEDNANQSENDFSQEIINLIWQQFALIQKIIQNCADITAGVLDVVQNSSAKYIEIRSTPKAMAGETIDDYINAFESGFLLAKRAHPHKKAVGLLSLDRSIHTLEDARYFITRILNSSAGMIVGLDISGNPIANRTLTSLDLKDLINISLDINLPIAIHMGEVDSEIERHDTDIILETMEQWKLSQGIQATDFFYGKVRLGHCIYLTEEQQRQITKLNIPVEICPTCHNKINWHKHNEAHPIVCIYGDVSQPIVPGTDDETVFGASAKKEFNNFVGIFSNIKSLSREQIKEHQSLFRFSK